MGKTVVMFPGQGAQVKDMGKDFYENSKEAQMLFKKAEEITGIKLCNLIFEENEDLNKTEFTQLALYVTEMMIFEELKKSDFKFDYSIGLSLGEYSAITASEVISYEDCVRLVRNRGKYMEEAVPAGIGLMAAILGLKKEEVEQVITDSKFNQVSIANYNCPGQIVITGEKNEVLAAMDKLKEAGAKRAIALNVSGPFHSKMLKPAGEKLAKDLADIKINAPKVPYVANLNAQIIEDTIKEDEIKKLLINQVSGSVMFEQSIRKLISEGCDTFVEAGPGKTLTGFVKKIAKDMSLDTIKTINIEKSEDINAYV